jgi:hypothetical protein
MSDSSSSLATVTRIWVVDHTGQKRVLLNGNFLTEDTTVGEVAERAREELRLPRGPHAVYYRAQRLSRSATLAEAGVIEDAELELDPEVKAAAR